MKILLLTQIVPYPPDSGPKVKTYHVLRYLADQGHAVTLVSFVRNGEERGLDALKPYCEDICAVPLRRSRLADIRALAASLRTGLPFLVTRDAKPGMFNTLRELFKYQTFDIIHADQLTMAQYALYARSRQSSVVSSQLSSLVLHPSSFILHPSSLIFDAHNAVHKIMERSTETAPLPLRPFLAREARLLKRYEGMLIRTFDHTLAVSDVDRQALLEAGGEFEIRNSKFEITTIPIAVDTDQLAPIHPIIAKHPVGTQSPNHPTTQLSNYREASRRDPTAQLPNILTLGTLFYPPNADGVRWFIREVLPLVRAQVPDASLTIVGPRPPKDIQQFAIRNSQFGITVTGYVPDLLPYLERASLIVIPVRAGSGMRVRILEALARGIPVVTTTMGAEGIEVVSGEHLLIADEPEAFARAVVRLLREPELCSRLAANGRKLAEAKYDWRVALPKLGEVYASLVPGSSVKTPEMPSTMLTKSTKELRGLTW